MKVLASISIAALLATVAAPAFAGPAGHGVTFTEEVAKRNAQKRTVSVQAAATCAAPAVTALSQRADVADAKAGDGVVHVTFHSAAAAKSQAGAVRAHVSDICRAA